MKIGGPKPPKTSPAPIPEGVAKSKGTRDSFRVGGGKAAAQAGEAAKAAQAKQADAAAQLNPVLADLVRQIKAKGLTGAEAAHKMIEQIVEARGKNLSSAQREQLSQVLRSTLESDPFLSERLRRLEQAAD